LLSDYQILEKPKNFENWETIKEFTLKEEILDFISAGENSREIFSFIQKETIDSINNKIFLCTLSSDFNNLPILYLQKSFFEKQKALYGENEKELFLKLNIMSKEKKLKKMQEEFIELNKSFNHLLIMKKFLSLKEKDRKEFLLSILKKGQIKLFYNKNERKYSFLIEYVEEQGLEAQSKKMKKILSFENVIDLRNLAYILLKSYDQNNNENQLERKEIKNFIFLINQVLEMTNIPVSFMFSSEIDPFPLKNFNFQNILTWTQNTENRLIQNWKIKYYPFAFFQIKDLIIIHNFLVDFQGENEREFGFQLLRT
jgi:hypothetical protein